jgi:hypothetical protein
VKKRDHLEENEDHHSHIEDMDETGLRIVAKIVGMVAGNETVGGPERDDKENAEKVEPTYGPGFHVQIDADRLVEGNRKKDDSSVTDPSDEIGISLVADTEHPEPRELPMKSEVAEPKVRVASGGLFEGIDGSANSKKDDGTK